MSYTGFCGEKHSKIHIKKEKKKSAVTSFSRSSKVNSPFKEQRLFDHLDHSQEPGSIVGVDWDFVF